MASYLLNPDNRQHGLDGVSFRELAWEKISAKKRLIGKGKDAIAFSQVQPEKMAQYAGEDADCAWQLQAVLQKKLKEEKIGKIISRFGTALNQRPGRNGRLWHQAQSEPLNRLAKKLEKRLNILTKRAYRLGQEEFNLNSTKQLQHILFVICNWTAAALKRPKPASRLQTTN